jgi:hypothetical protein
VPEHSRPRLILPDPLGAFLIESSLILLAVGVPLALGGVHRPTLVAAAGLAALAVLLVWLHRRATHRGIRVPPFAGILLAVTGYTVLQAVPIPVGLLRVLAPSSVELLRVSLAGAGGLGGFHPISLDPGATLLEALKVGACALALCAAHNYSYRRSRRDRLLLAVVIGGVVVTLLGFLGAVAAPGKPLMLYEPEAGRAAGLITTSFVNSNHGSAFLTLATLVAAGLAVAARDLQRRVLLALGAILLGAGVFMTLSRGGILALGLGLGVLALLLLLRPVSPGERRSLSAAAVPGILGLILALSAWLAFEAIVSEFRQIRPELDTNLGKIGLWPSGLSMALANPWVGVGRGAFLTAFPRYLEGELPRTATYSHLEMQYLHLPAELGLPIALGLIAASAIALWVWFRRSPRDPASTAIVAALCALAGHALVDFNLETLGVALPAALLAGLLSASARTRSEEEDAARRADAEPAQEHPPEEAESKRSKHRSRSRAKRGRGKVHTRRALASAIGLCGLATWAAIAMPPSANDDLAQIGALVRDRAPREQTLAAIREAIRRHPADPMPHLAAGRLLAAGEVPALALPHLNRAMVLFPGSPEIHLETAETLRRMGRRGQALLEYRLALEHGASGTAIARALAIARDSDEVARGLPDRPEPHAAAIGILLRAQRRPLAAALAAALAARARARWPGSLEAAAAEIEVLLATARTGDAAVAARRLGERSPLPRTFHLWARATAAAAPGSEIPVLEDARARFPKEESFSFALAEAFLRGKQLARARETAEAILAQVTTPASLAAAHDLLARVHLADGRPHRARYEAEQARKIREGR